jgi:hypothetical protein
VTPEKRWRISCIEIGLAHLPALTGVVDRLRDRA